MALFPTVPDPVALRPVAPAPPAGSDLGLDWRFDFEKGDFTIDKDGQVPKVRGGLVPAQQVVATCLVDRAFHRMFSRRHGINYEYAQAKRQRQQTEASLETQIRDRLKRIRGVKDVVNFTFRNGPFEVFYPPREVKLPPTTEGGKYADVEGDFGTYQRMKGQQYGTFEKVTQIPERVVIAGGGFVKVPADALAVRFTVVLDVGARYSFEVVPHGGNPPAPPLKGRYLDMEIMGNYATIATHNYGELEPPPGSPPSRRKA
jgi:hypothetical protein